MRRLWVFLAAVVLLAQWSYAAAGAYCTHESERSSSAAHWGHHFHAHAAGSDANDEPAKNGGTVHADCAFCHAVSTSVPVTHVTQAASPVAAAPSSAAAPPYQSRGPDTPDRPKWSVLHLA